MVGVDTSLDFRVCIDKTKIVLSLGINHFKISKESFLGEVLNDFFRDFSSLNLETEEVACELVAEGGENDEIFA